MELSELALILKEQQEVLREKYDFKKYTYAYPRSSAALDFDMESGGLTPQPTRSVDTPLTMQEIDSLREEFEL
jgi:hypothetical protein